MFSICVCIEGVGTQGRGKGEEGGGRGRELGGGMLFVFYPHIFSPSFSLSCFLCMICIRGSFLFCCLFFSSASFFPED